MAENNSNTVQQKKGEVDIEQKFMQIKALSRVISAVMACGPGVSAPIDLEEIYVVGNMIYDLTDEVENWYLNLDEGQGANQGQTAGPGGES